MKILVLDNYDSFTYNLVHIIAELGYREQMDIYRNDKISLDDVAQYDKILLSPGPGLPKEAGIMLDLIEKYAATKSIFGVCLGHQGIAEVFGAKIYNMEEVLHGVATKIIVKKKNEPLFKDLSTEFMATRYHSWSVAPDSMTDVLEVTAVDEREEIMALAHKSYDVRGVQFHPESILTEHGKMMIQNWLKH